MEGRGVKKYEKGCLHTVKIIDFKPPPTLERR